MSYFYTYVILPKEGEKMLTVDNLLAPYDEGLVVNPYITDYKKDAKKLHEERLAKYKGILDHPNKHKDIDALLDQYNWIKSMSDEEYFEYISEGEKRDKEGNILAYYNPNAKWDFYEEQETFTVEQAMGDKKIPFALVLPNGTWLGIRETEGWPVKIEEQEEDEKWWEIVTQCYRQYQGHTIVMVKCHI